MRTNVLAPQSPVQRTEAFGILEIHQGGEQCSDAVFNTPEVEQGANGKAFTPSI